jgi:hypothetical protein
MIKLLARVSLILMGFGGGLITYFVTAGSYVDQTGLLVEEFWAWALGIYLLLAGIFGFLLSRSLPFIRTRFSGNS